MNLGEWDWIFIIVWTLVVVYHVDKRLNTIINLINRNSERNEDFLD